MAKQKLSSKEASDAAKALEALFVSEHIDRKRLYVANFWRGVSFSIGSVVGAAIIISLLLWVMASLKRVPLVGPLVNNIRNSVEEQQTK